jgi:DNA polymerase-3 subunit delta'
MPDISPVLNEISSSREWKELREMLSSGGAPGALLAIVASGRARHFRDMYARIVLCDEGSGSDGCASCRSWMDDGHPDMVVAGSSDGPPGIADCLEMQTAMSLRPFCARGRLGVVHSVDAISLPAANSLLKIAEEPPEGGHLLFLAEEDHVISTIRSRSWTVSFKPEETAGDSPPPATTAEWAAWIERTRKLSADEIAPEADGWAGWLCGRGEFGLAASVRNMLYISNMRHLPVSMVQDALEAILREGVPIEQILGDLR